MIINLIIFTSLLHKQASVRSSHEIILTESERYFTVNFIDYQNISKLASNDFSILFIATGGAERLVIQYFESLPRPAIILADGMQNSLAAAFEVFPWLRGRGMKSKILHGELPEIIKYIFILHSNFMTQRSLFGIRISVVGTPSSWLIANNVDYLLAKHRQGVEYTDVSPDRICEYYNQITDDEVSEAYAHFTGEALAYREASPEDIIEAMRLCRAIRRIVGEDRLSALTLSCFRLIERAGTTGYLALSLLSDEGIIAECEGGLQSVFTMFSVKVLTRKPAFMANPSMISARANELILVHYTIGIAQTEQLITRGHFETESGIGIQEILPAGDVTIVKCGGECLDEYCLSTGALTESTSYINMCRAQVRIKMNTPAEYSLRNLLDNHHIMLHGNYEQMIDELLQSNGCKKIG